MKRKIHILFTVFSAIIRTRRSSLSYTRCAAVHLTFII